MERSQEGAASSGERDAAVQCGWLLCKELRVLAASTRPEDLAGDQQQEAAREGALLLHNGATALTAAMMQQGPWCDLALATQALALERKALWRKLLHSERRCEHEVVAAGVEIAVLGAEVAEGERWSISAVVELERRALAASAEESNGEALAAQLVDARHSHTRLAAELAAQQQETAATQAGALSVQEGARRRREELEAVRTMLRHEHAQRAAVEETNQTLRRRVEAAEVRQRSSAGGYVSEQSFLLEAPRGREVDTSHLLSEMATLEREEVSATREEVRFSLMLQG